MKRQTICLVVWVVIAVWGVNVSSLYGSETFFLDSASQWAMALEYGGEPNAPGGIRPAELEEWFAYVRHWRENSRTDRGDDPARFAEADYARPELYTYAGDDPCWPDNNGMLVMGWGDPWADPPDRDIAGAWIYDYGADPSLAGCTITLKVHPPVGMVFVSFGIVDAVGKKVSWDWAVPAAIPHAAPGTWTTIVINTDDIITLGLNAPFPPATGFALDPGFNIDQAQSFIIHETWHTTPGLFPVPPPNGFGNFYWNAWDEFRVTKNDPLPSDYWLKWNQEPDIADGHINGWDEVSMLFPQGNSRAAADDWLCEDDRAVIGFRFWGSYKNWPYKYPPHWATDQPNHRFRYSIWSDVPANTEPGMPSHPGECLWAHDSDKWCWVFAGYDEDPRGIDGKEACFLYIQYLDEPDWFVQGQHEHNGRFWLCIQADYEGLPMSLEEYPWGWKTCPQKLDTDDGYVLTNIVNTAGTTGAGAWPISEGDQWVDGFPIEYPENTSWDLAFQLVTNQPGN